MRNAVVLASDNTLLPPAIWLWRTLVEQNPRPDTDIILISEAAHEKLWGVPVPSGWSLSSADLDLPDLSYPTLPALGKATYWRIAAPRVLAGRYRRLLYLDIDILPVSPSLFACFDYDLAGRAIAACQSPVHFKAARRRNGKTLDGEFEFDRYFNAGVMVIDPAAFVSAQIDKRAFEVIERFGDRLPLRDQTALNLAAQGNWVDLSLAYNFWAGALGSFLERRCPPKIIHYHGGAKPWHLFTPYSDHPIRLNLLSSLTRRGHWPLLLRGMRPLVLAYNVLRHPAGRYIRTDNAELMAYLGRSDFIDLPSRAAGMEDTAPA